MCPVFLCRRSLLLSLLLFGCHSANIHNSIASLSFSASGGSTVVSAQGQDVTIDLGNVAVGQIVSVPIDVSSLSGSGVTVVSITNVQPNPALSFPLDAGIVVEPAPPTVVGATFAPTQPGNQSASWSLSLGEGKPIALTLQGNGFPVSLTINPNPVDFGNVELHTHALVPVTVTNTSSQPIDLGLLPPDSGPFNVPMLDGGHLGVGGSLTLGISYSPLQIETDSSSFTLTGCLGCTSGVTVPLRGNGVTSTLSFPSPFQFGFVDPRTSLPKTLALRNIGSSSLQILSAPALYPGSATPPQGEPPVYALGTPTTDVGVVVSYPLDLPGGTELDLPITFTPPQIGAYLDGTVTVLSSDPAIPQTVISLQGYGGGARISCTPASLDLGPVAVGYIGTQPLLCLNAGTDVPGHAEAALQLSRSQLSTDNPLFAATLPGGNVVSLKAGQSATIEVSFTPLDAGASNATLEVGSNDITRSPFTVPLTGRGVVPGPCLASVLPIGGLDFGEVPKGSVALQQVAIQNTGVNYCIVRDLDLDAGSDPAYSLPNGNMAYALVSFPGDPNNTTHLPTELRVPVQFVPTQSETSATGEVDFRIANAQPSRYAVPLKASSVPACLSFDPSEVNFGLVGIDLATQSLCFKPRQTITAANSCSSPVTVESISLDKELDGIAQFGSSGLPSLPLTISPGGQVSFTVTFQATQIGSTTEAVEVTTDEFATPYGLSLTGDAETTGDRTDSFVVPQKQVDLLLILDTDDDGLVENINNCASQFVAQLPDLIKQASTEYLDFQIAVTTSGTLVFSPDAGNPILDLGYFSPCDHCLLNKAPNDPIYITPRSLPNPGQMLSQLVSAVWSALGEEITAPDEQFFEVPYETFAPALLAGHNAGFLRPAAFLTLLTINCDAEDDQTGYPPDKVVAFLQSLKPANPSLVTWSYVNYGLGVDQTSHVANLAAAMGGIVIDVSLNGWQKELVNLFSSTIGLGTFHLGAYPNVDSLQVVVNGSSLSATTSDGDTNWSYSSSQNAVVFTAGALPIPGSTLAISYSVACP